MPLTSNSITRTLEHATSLRMILEYIVNINYFFMQPVPDRYLQFRSENFKENKRMEELSWLKWKFNCCFLQLKKIWHLENLFWDTLYNIFSSYYPELVYAARARHAKFIHDTMSLKPMNAGSICTRWYLFIWYSHMSYDVFFRLTMHVPRAA